MTPQEKRIEDWGNAGFHKLDPEVLKPNPPKIKWSALYKEWDADKKIHYLENLASTMNFAAAQIQQERDWFAEMCTKKEQQIESIKEANAQNNALLQSEITRMNAERQQYNKAFADLNAEVRALKNGNID